MNCRRFKRLLPSYLYGEIREKDKQIFIGHASDCSSCRKLLAEMEETVSFLRSQPRIEFSRSELESLKTGVKKEIARPERIQLPRRHPGFLHSLFRYRVPVPVTAVLFIALLVGVSFLLRPETSQELTADPEVNKLEALTETIDNELKFVAEINRQLDELESLFPKQAGSDSEVKYFKDNKVIQV